MCRAGYGVTTSPQAFVDACGLAGMSRYLNNGEDDEFSPLLTLPFPFTFFGAAQTNYWVTSNGSLGFGSVRDSVVGAVCPLPDARYAIPLIMGFNDDLASRSGAEFGICVATTGAAPNRKLVATWQPSRVVMEAGQAATLADRLRGHAQSVGIPLPEHVERCQCCHRSSIR